MSDPGPSDFDKTHFVSPGSGTRGAKPDRLPVLIVLRGTQAGRRYLLNENALVLGRRPDRADLVIPDDPQISSVHCRIVSGPEPGAWTLTDLSSTNGTLVWGEPVTTTTLRDGDRIHLGDTVLKFCFHDELEEAFHRHVDQLMNIDDLTGLPVQRVFRQRFLDAIRDGLRFGRTLAVFMMDMDGLKKINDTHGHQIGANAIAVVGRRLGSVIAAESGIVSRFGGDEFSAFVPVPDAAGAVAFGERLRAAVADEPIRFAGTVVNPTMSVGFAVFPADGTGPEVLTRQADEALYRAKAAGRNRVSA